MSFAGIANRVHETSTTTGTGTITLGGATEGYRTFVSALGAGNACSYVISMGSAWETGVGLIHSGGYLSRETVLSSSNSNSAVSFDSGTKDVFISDLAELQDASLFTAGQDVLARDVVLVAVSGGFGTTGGRIYKANATRASYSVEAMVAGFAVHSAVSGFPVLVKKYGVLGGFTGLTAGATYYVSNVNGEITSTQPANAKVVGVAVSTTQLFINTELDFKYRLTPATTSNLGLLGPGISSNGSGSSGNSVLRGNVAEYLDLTTDTGNAATFGTTALAVSSYGCVGSASTNFLCGGVR